MKLFAKSFKDYIDAFHIVWDSCNLFGKIAIFPMISIPLVVAGIVLFPLCLLLCLGFKEE